MYKLKTAHFSSRLYRIYAGIIHSFWLSTGSGFGLARFSSVSSKHLSIFGLHGAIYIYIYIFLSASLYVSKRGAY